MWNFVLLKSMIMPPQFVNPIDSTDVRETMPVGEIVTLVSGSDGKIYSFVYKNSSLYSKDSQIIEVF